MFADTSCQVTDTTGVRMQYKLAGAWQEARTVDLQSIQQYELALLRRKASEPEDRFGSKR